MNEADLLGAALIAFVLSREFTKGGSAKGGLAIYVFPLCNSNTLVLLLMCKLNTYLIAKPPFTNPPL